jgi:hypothetical protein
MQYIIQINITFPPPPFIKHAAPHIVEQWIKQLVAGFAQRSNVFDSKEKWY